MNRQLIEICNSVVQDNSNEKLILIEDIIRVKKTLWSFGYVEHDEFLNDSTAANLFDNLYDMNLEQLELINSGYEKQINEHLSKMK